MSLVHLFMIWQVFGLHFFQLQRWTKIQNITDNATSIFSDRKILSKKSWLEIQIFEFIGIRKRNIDIPFKHNPANIYLLEVNNRNARKRYEVCSKLTIKTPAWRHWRRSGVFIVNLEHNSHFSLVFLLLSLSK